MSSNVEKFQMQIKSMELHWHIQIARALAVQFNYFSMSKKESNRKKRRDGQKLKYIKLSGTSLSISSWGQVSVVMHWAV